MLLPRLDIRGFRALADVSIAPLGRVNLITGRNGVGKSSVLDAVALYARAGHPLEFYEQLDARDELDRPVAKASETVSAAAFHGASKDGRGARLRIGAGDANAEIQLSVEDAVRRREDSGRSRLHLLQEGEATEEPVKRVLVSRRGAETLALTALDIELDDLRTFTQRAFEPYEAPCGVLPAGGIHGDDVEAMWDAAVVGRREELVADMVRVIVPDLDRITLVNRTGNQTGRMAIAFGRSLPDARALASFGDGATRAFHIGLVINLAAGGVALLDEFENGVHYAAQLGLWRLVFRAAAEYDVQVFATTHSRDCIEAFQQASSETPQVGTLIRLDRQKGVVRAHVFDEPKLEAAVQLGLEVR